MVKKMMHVVFAVIAVATMVETTQAKEYTVGDKLGWTIPPHGADDYDDWAADHNPLLILQDNITFAFKAGEQDVAFVTKEDYDSCNTANLIWHAKETAKVTFVDEGTFYFIGTLAGHCSKGQKIALNWANTPSPAPSPTLSNDDLSTLTLMQTFRLIFSPKKESTNSSIKSVILSKEGAI